ncbi:uncharacterized protein LOC113859453 [Abrus precatorius]|uniref:Uncharacterized protein LOC113859453 n=1 Tax=Abrus precatorius TaxID=3816 RepID=A0A8B8KVQ0_ABRPR|nr:uncharacterized protein LOC113859453 [Abrus precatorius]
MVKELELIKKFRDMNLAVEVRPQSLYLGTLIINTDFLPLEIPEWKLDSISMDFVSDLPRTKSNHDTIWVIVDRLTKTAHFLSINMKYKLEKLADMYVREIVRLHGVPTSVVSDRDPSYQASIGMAPFEALYGKKCRTPLYCYETREAILYAPDMVQKQHEQIKLIREKMKIAQDRQRSYYDKRRKSLEFQVSEHVFLKVSPVTGVGRALKSKKLSPKFIGPFEVLSKVGPVAYEIALPLNLSNLHPVFHVSQLRKYIPDPTHVIELDLVQVRENLSNDVQPVKIVDRRVKKLKGKDISLVKVIWNTSDEGDATWETKNKMRELYLDLFLRKYVPDSSHIIEPDVVELRDDLSVEVPAARIEETRVKELRGKSIRLIKVVWDPVTGDATWEYRNGSLLDRLGSFWIT